MIVRRVLGEGQDFDSLQKADFGFY